MSHFFDTPGDTRDTTSIITKAHGAILLGLTQWKNLVTIVHVDMSPIHTKLFGNTFRG